MNRVSEDNPMKPSPLAAGGHTRISLTHLAATNLLRGSSFACSHLMICRRLIPSLAANASWLRPFLSRCSLRFMPDGSGLRTVEK